MSNGRHSYVAFYPSDWLGGTARLSRLHRSVYFDVCCYNWDLAAPCPAVELSVMISDLKGGAKIVEDLIAMGKLIRNEDGSVENPKALAEALKALAAWQAMSQGGRGRAKGDAKVDTKPLAKGLDNPLAKGAATEPELKREANASPRASDGVAADLIIELCQAASIVPPDPGLNFDKHKAALSTIEGWLAAGADPALIRETITSRAAGLRTPARALAFFETPVLEAVAKLKADGSMVDATTDSIMARVLGRAAQ